MHYQTDQSHCPILAGNSQPLNIQFSNEQNSCPELNCNFYHMDMVYDPNNYPHHLSGHLHTESDDYIRDQQVYSVETFGSKRFCCNGNHAQESKHVTLGK